jgi:hypothetical protein
MGRKATSKASRPSPKAGEGRGTLKFKWKFRNKFRDNIVSKTNQHEMNCPSGIIGGATRSIVGSTDAKGRTTAPDFDGVEVVESADADQLSP